MMECIEHRGPDDDGSYVERGIGLGFRRLSIVDIGGGHQPMTNKSKSLWLTFNGEIYNHQLLRTSLESQGHRYNTRSDTESIVHLYEEKGLDCFALLQGMFAIALWDISQQRFVLARDRLGIKPVYYYLNNDIFIYSSEIKAILKHPSVTPQFRQDCIKELLSYRYIAGEETVFAGIKTLAPGHFLVIENGTVKVSQYWDVDISRESQQYDSMDDAVDNLQQMLTIATKDRLMADVALGTLCSGGVDSSLTTALAVEQGMSQINTFSVGFHEKEFDETQYAQAVSKCYQTNHHQLIISGEDFANALPKLIWQNDEPLNHPNSVQIFKVSELARNFVTVLLTGEGADELFGGYPRYLIPKIASALHPLPAALRGGIGNALALLPSHRLQKLSWALALQNEEILLENSRINSSQQVDAILRDTSDCQTSYRKYILQKAKSNSENWQQQLFYLEIKTYLVSILHRMDKMTMAAKVEGRVPFLDHRIVEWAATLPLHFKMPNLENKAIVKRLGERKLPKEIIYRQKSGFGVPLDKWFRDPTKLGRYLPLLTNSQSETTEYLDQKVLQLCIVQHLDGSANYGELLWMLVNLELWHRIYISGTDPDAIAATQP